MSTRHSVVVALPEKVLTFDIEWNGGIKCVGWRHLTLAARLVLHPYPYAPCRSSRAAASFSIARMFACRFFSSFQRQPET